MLIFSSGRTDIPAFYSEWFLNRIRDGFVDVRNPYYSEQVARYKLTPDVVDCLVFCTKNPAPMIPHLEELKSKKMGLYFFVTITPYEKDVEPNVPEKEQVLDSFIEMSKILGKDQVCWRYDPIFTDEKYSVSFHIKAFRKMAEKLRGTTDRCMISFIDLYEKTKKNFPGIKEVSEQDQKFLAQSFSRIGFENDIKIESCAEKLDLTAYGVEQGACVSRQIVEKASGIHLLAKAGKSNLRKHCICLPTTDIGAYNSCPHLCKYCYANYDKRLVEKNFARHNPNSTFLLGESKPDDIFHYAKQESLRDRQLFLF
ncbi:DUF1848 family protein [uncultured Treponema sp.]|uniref:DUF1848 domain-containing protein n=1 Tax=uncultured Treponema sp. TaxID=162155 RepID=UPI0025EF709A|nr:DUF1848 family protein [uncultured Treponema sp.]